MNKHRCVASCTQRRPSSHAIWITDDILADAFHRFAHVRRGSHVPGPLEFRKRANRRRNTNLAHAAAPPAIDPVALFAKKPDRTWWTSKTPPRAPVKNSESAVLSWLFKPPDRVETSGATRDWQHGWQTTNTDDSAATISSQWMESIRPTHQNTDVPSLTALKPVPQLQTLKSDPTEQLKLDCQPEFTQELISEPATTNETAQQCEFPLSPSSPLNQGMVPPVSAPDASFTTTETSVPSEFSQSSSSYLDLAMSIPQITFETKLASCDSINSLEAFILDHEAVTQLTNEQHRCIFEHAQRWTATEFAQYLKQPQFHPPGSGNFSLLAQRLYKSSSSTLSIYKGTDLHGFINAISDAVKSGLVSAAEWTQLVDALLSWSSVESMRPIANYVVKRLAVTYELCPTLDVSSLDHVWIQSLLKTLEDHDVIRSRALRFRLHCWLPIPDIASMADIYIRWLPSRKLCNIIENPKQMLGLLSRDVLLCLCGRVTAQLLTPSQESAESGGGLVKHLQKKWSQVLDGFERLGFTANNMTLEDADNFKLGLPTDMPDSKQLIALLWFVHRTQTPRRSVEWTTTNWCLSDVFDLGKLGVEDSGMQLYNHLLSTANSMTIAHDDFAEELPRLLGNLNASASFLPTEVLLPIVQANLAELMHVQKYMNARKSAHEPFGGLVTALNLDMNSFQDLIRTLVFANKLNLRFIMRSIKNNRHFRTALARSWPRPRHSNSERILSCDIDPAHALDTIHVLATACALSPALGSRMAFIKVKECLDYLLDCQAYISSPITRALWHAGVARNKSCADTQLRWILQQVVKYEGEEVARALVESPEYRQHRERGIYALEHGVLSLGDGSPPISRSIDHLVIPADVAAIGAEVEAQAIAIDQQQREETAQRQSARRSAAYATSAFDALMPDDGQGTAAVKANARVTARPNDSNQSLRPERNGVSAFDALMQASTEKKPLRKCATSRVNVETRWS